MDLEERVRLLEERSRRLEELVAELATGKLRAIETNCLTLVNQEGQVQGILAAAPGEAAMALTDPTGKSSIAFGVGKNGPHMQFTHKDGTMAMELAVREKGLTVIEMRDAKSNPRITVGIDNSGPHIELLDERRQAVLELKVGKGKSPMIVLNDDKGRARMMLNVDGTSTDSANLVLRDVAGQICGLFDCDAKGKVRFMLGDLKDANIMMNASPQSSEIVFGDKGPQLRLALGLAAGTKQPYVTVYNEASQPRVTMGVSETHSGLAVNDSHGTNRVLAIVDSDERPWFIIRDDHQKDRLRMTIMPDGSSGVAIHDQQGQLVALLGGGSRNMASLTIKDATGRSQALLAFGPEGPALIMTDDAGQPIFTAP